MTQAVPTSAPVSSSYDSFIRGLIGLLLLAAVALGGYVGWHHLRHQ
ncbi:MAG: hypothetical protein H0T73_11635 [Ardenticatenales bacterium]|nr:hypothetical protein [Ardenticatenales bacterium]